jgi:hypothetical protein
VNRSRDTGQSAYPSHTRVSRTPSWQSTTWSTGQAVRRPRLP